MREPNFEANFVDDFKFKQSKPTTRELKWKQPMTSPSIDECKDDEEEENKSWASSVFANSILGWKASERTQRKKRIT